MRRASVYRETLRRLLAICVAIAAGLVMPRCATVSTGPATCDGGVQVLSDELTPREAEAYCLGTVMDERTAYILAGSFVGFLIERHGLPQFRALYDARNWEQVYGQSLGTLEQEWRAALAR